jgi:hypothetical protein
MSEWGDEQIERAAAHGIISTFYTKAVENARRHYVQRARPARVPAGTSPR